MAEHDSPTLLEAENARLIALLEANNIEWRLCAWRITNRAIKKTKLDFAPYTERPCYQHVPALWRAPCTNAPPWPKSPKTPMP